MTLASSNQILFVFIFCFHLLTLLGGNLFTTQLQRTLQLRIEEQGKHLQKLFEEQQKATSDLTSTSPSSSKDESHTRPLEPVLIECKQPSVAPVQQ